MFFGAALIAPLLVLAVYDYGTGRLEKSVTLKFFMSLSYVRYGLQAMIYSIYANRKRIPCPDTEIYCVYNEPKIIMADMGMENIDFWFDFWVLLSIFLFLKFIGYYLLYQRLSPNKTFSYLQMISKVLKSQFNIYSS